MEKKKARIVEVPEGVLELEVYDDLLQHARKSSIWYLSRYPSHSSKIKERLYEKGYPRDSITYYNLEGEKETSNIVEQTIEDLQLIHALDDKRYIESKLKSIIARGKGLFVAKRELQYKGIPKQEIELVAEELEDELQEMLTEYVEKAASKLLRSSPYRKAANSWQRRMIVSQGLQSKGFDSDTIEEWLEMNADTFEDNN